MFKNIILFITCIIICILTSEYYNYMKSNMDEKSNILKFLHFGYKINNITDSLFDLQKITKKYNPKHMLYYDLSSHVLNRTKDEEYKKFNEKIKSINMTEFDKDFTRALYHINKLGEYYMKFISFDIKIKYYGLKRKIKDVFE